MLSIKAVKMRSRWPWRSFRDRCRNISIYQIEELVKMKRKGVLFGSFVGRDVRVCGSNERADAVLFCAAAFTGASGNET